jgi:hypothetical protein
MSDDNKKHPPTTFSTEYPYNQATLTRSGHEIHINDAPDNESLRIAHAKGTYAEIDKTGRLVNVVVGKTYMYHGDGYSQVVEGHHDIKVNGTSRVNVDGSTSQEITESLYTGVGGQYQIGVEDSMILYVGGERYEAVTGNTTISHEANYNHSITGD